MITVRSKHTPRDYFKVVDWKGDRLRLELVCHHGESHAPGTPFWTTLASSTLELVG